MPIAFSNFKVTVRSFEKTEKNQQKNSPRPIKDKVSIMRKKNWKDNIECFSVVKSDPKKLWKRSVNNLIYLINTMSGVQM